MTTAAALGSHTVLADRLLTRSVATDATLIFAGAAITAGLAQVEVPMWPVPITGQTLAVMVVGAALGARRGAMALGLYLVLGVIGLPIFAGFTGGPLSVLKPSFGFIIGFVFAAALIGWLAERNWDRKALPALAGFLFASLVPFAFGLPYMAIVLGNLGMANDIGTVLAFGVYPFILGGIAKWLIAASVLPLAWKGVRATDARSK